MLKREKLKALIKDAQERLAKLPPEAEFVFSTDGPTKGFTITCKNCLSTGPFLMKEVYSPELVGMSETIPDQTWLVLYCKKCNNRVSIWTDWRPNNVNLD